MKTLLPVMVLAVMASTSYAADQVTSPFYILIYPTSTIETDLYGRCLRVANVGDALVFLPAGTKEVWSGALDVAVNKGKLKVMACGAR